MVVAALELSYQESVRWLLHHLSSFTSVHIADQTQLAVLLKCKVQATADNTNDRWQAQECLQLLFTERGS